jgi:hypothetical protein
MMVGKQTTGTDMQFLNTHQLQRCDERERERERDGAGDKEAMVGILPSSVMAYLRRENGIL